MEIKNVVVKLLNAEHSLEVMRTFRSLGVDTGNYSGIHTEKNRGSGRDETIYYGMVSNSANENHYFNCVSLRDLGIHYPYTKIITLQQLKLFGAKPIEVW